MKLEGGLERKRAYEQGVRRLGLKDAPAISESRSGEEGDEYYVQHPLDPGRKLFLSDHLKRGADRDERNCLRIYYTWDAEEQLVVVGWLPGHLQCRLS